MHTLYVAMSARPLTSFLKLSLENSVQKIVMKYVNMLFSCELNSGVGVQNVFLLLLGPRGRHRKDSSRPCGTNRMGAHGPREERHGTG